MIINLVSYRARHHILKSQSVFQIKGNVIDFQFIQPLDLKNYRSFDRIEVIEIYMFYP